MPSVPWTDADTKQMMAMYKQAIPLQKIADTIGRSYSSIRSRMRHLKKHKSEKPVSISPKEKQAFSESALRGQVERQQIEIEELRRSLSPQRVQVETAAEPPTNPKDMWEAAEADAERRIKYAAERAKFRVKFDDGPIAIAFVSDQHIAPGTPVDFRRMREDAELINETDGLYACLGGDGVDNHIKIRPAVLSARSQPHEQWELFEWYLSIFASKIIALISGNHDAWTDQIAGIDMLAQIAKRQALAYAPAEARIHTTVAGQEYGIAFRHQYRYNSSFNQGHTVKQWWRMGDSSFDIGCICHHHEPHIESFEAHGLTRWACRPGSYQITSAYSRQFGFNATRPTCPTFILSGTERRIIGFRDVRDAVEVLKTLRKG